MLANSLWSNTRRLRLPHTLLGQLGLCKFSSPRSIHSGLRAVVSHDLTGFRDVTRIGLRSNSSRPQLSRFSLSNTTARSYAAGVLSFSSPRANLARPLEPRFFSSSFNSPTDSLPALSPPSVGRWLLFSSALVFAVIVVGGVTRLTESGLSITEWRPITGILPPLSEVEWVGEFEKYKTTPEFKLLNHSITIDEFKNIFYMEWAHRILGRVIGITFVLPLTYFALRKKLTPTLPTKLTSMAFLIGIQGLLGWYMVKSGLENSLMDDPTAVPRVSQYRLAAHLGTAFVLYAGMLGTGLAVLSDWRYAQGGLWSGVDASKLGEVLMDARVRRFRRFAWVLTGLVFLTALSGAFVAGLDAGLVYNEFPLMGGRLAPPSDELFSAAYAKKPDGSDLWWRNMLENPTTVQFDHRVLAITTYLSTSLLYLHTLRPTLQPLLPPLTRACATAAFAMVHMQVLLGISTLVYLVPVPLAAAHQAGSVVLLSTMVWLLSSLRRPGRAARVWREVRSRAGRV